MCTFTPILTFANFTNNLNYIQMCAFAEMGTMLYQNQDGIGRVIGYACRGLSKTKHKHLAHKLKFLVLRWAITEQFHEYLYGNTFIVSMDNNPITHIITSARLDVTGYHQVARLTNYNLTLSYKSGKVNVCAVTLSHIL